MDRFPRGYGQDGQDGRHVTLVTDHGSLTVALVPERAPVTVANFLRHVRTGVLDAAQIYRIVTRANQAPGTIWPIEVIEWGLPYRDGVPDPAFAPIRHETTAETGLRHRDGTLSMARFTAGSACSNFFFCIGDQPALDHGGLRHPDGLGFAAFGHVIAGRDVLRRLMTTAGAGEYLAVPLPVRPAPRAHGA